MASSTQVPGSITCEITERAHRLEAKPISQRQRNTCMESELEERVESLRGNSLSDRTLTNPEDYGWWIAANFGDQLLSRIDDSPDSQALTALGHVRELAAMSEQDYEAAYGTVIQNHILYLQSRAQKIEAEQCPSITDFFLHYTSKSLGVLETLAQAVGDHLGTDPDELDAGDLRAIKQIHDVLQEAYELVEPYGYHLDSK